MAVSPTSSASALRHCLVDRIARIRGRVDAVAETHDLVLAGEHLAECLRLPSSGVSKLEISSMAASLAPPCSGPRSAPIAPVTAECMSESVPVMTRAVNVDALNSCSAYRISVVSRLLRCSSFGGLSCSRCRKWPAMPSSSVSVSMRLPSVVETVPVQQHRRQAGEQPVRDVAAGWRNRPRARYCRGKRRRCAARPSDERPPGTISRTVFSASGRPRFALIFAT